VSASEDPPSVPLDSELLRRHAREPEPPPRPAPGDAPSIPLDDGPRPARPSNPFEPRAGQLCGPYRLLDAVGAGGFSLVWRAEHLSTRRVVALKLPRVPEFIAHLKREALVGALLQDEQVVGVLEVHLDHDPPFLVMPFVPGVDLRLPDHAPEPQGIVEAFTALRNIARVVARLHDGGIVHGDLKPGNIRYNEEGACVLLDLGLARHQVAVRQNSTLRASVVSVTGEKIAGTLEYMAPEVMSGGRPGPAADVYALGVILHHLLCGRPPAFGVSPDTLNPHLPHGATDFLRAMLHPDPAMRIATASELIPFIDGFMRAEERCLRRRNGHARRLVFYRRMRTLARGAKILGLSLACVTSIVVFLRFGLPMVPTSDEFAITLAGLSVIPACLLLFIGMLLGMTTLNAWLVGIPEKTYKNRSGHPWWTFMMQ
jgi:serine/threonine protein kinase